MSIKTQEYEQWKKTWTIFSSLFFLYKTLIACSKPYAAILCKKAEFWGHQTLALRSLGDSIFLGMRVTSTLTDNVNYTISKCQTNKVHSSVLHIPTSHPTACVLFYPKVYTSANLPLKLVFLCRMCFNSAIAHVPRRKEVIQHAVKVETCAAVLILFFFFFTKSYNFPLIHVGTRIANT